MSSATISGSGAPNPAVVERILLDEGMRAMQVAVGITHAEVLRRMERHRRTGHMMRSVFAHPTVQGKKVVGTVGSNVDYVRWLEYGTGLYGPRNAWIVPRRAQALRFPQPGNAGFTLAGRQRSGRAGANARWVYAKRVRGVRPLRMFRDSALVVTPKVTKVFELHGQRAAVRIAKAWGGR